MGREMATTEAMRLYLDQDVIEAIKGQVGRGEVGVLGTIYDAEAMVGGVLPTLANEFHYYRTGRRDFDDIAPHAISIDGDVLTVNTPEGTDRYEMISF